MTASTLITDYIAYGLLSARPTTPPVASGVSSMYYATDTTTLYIWDGTWNIAGAAAGGEGIPNFSPPLAAHFTGSSQTSGGSTMTLTDDSNFGLVMQCNTTVGGDVPKYVYKTITNTSAWQVTTRIRYNGLAGTNNYGGIIVGDSTGGKCVINGWITNSTSTPPQFIGINDNITGGHNGNTYAAGYPPPDQFIRINWNGTDITVSFSLDGSANSFMIVYQNTLSSYGLSNNPNQLGLGWAQGVSYTGSPASMVVPYWTDNA